MENNMFNRLFVLLLISVLMTGCRHDKKMSVTNKIEFDSISVNETYHMMGKPDNPNCNLQLKFIYPVKFDNKEVLRAIQKQFVSAHMGEMYEELSPEEAVQKYTNIYLDDYKSLEKDFKEETERSHSDHVTSWFSYYEIFSNEIKYNMNDLLCYSIYFENYTGGAHGAHSLVNYVLNLKTGEVMTEKDIFVEDFQDAIAQMLVDKIAGQNEVENAKELENVGFFSADEIFPNSNFLVDEEGITYYFNEYEIAAYVVGITSVKLPYGEIRHLLRKDSPISKLISD
ncbi:MAG: DUF3298 and DUF4163 domain-containing protein [Tannerellaceae bacterium]|jgi:hypothetical protein|nr:DUF3298 and DUF4163 domain-containing protein [Tannerellaceae bacterium]